MVWVMWLIQGNMDGQTREELNWEMEAYHVMTAFAPRLDRITRSTCGNTSDVKVELMISLNVDD